MFTFSGEIKGAVSQDMLLINSLKNSYKKSFSQSYLFEWRFKKLSFCNFDIHNYDQGTLVEMDQQAFPN